jgi:hypothetical protein
VGREERFGTAVVGFEVSVGERPCGRDAAFVVDDAEVLGTEAEEGSAIDLGLTADEVGLLRMERLIVFVEPNIFGVVAIVEEDGGGIPVEFFLRKKRATLKDEDALASLSQIECEGPAASSGSDDDDVILLGHCISPIVRCMEFDCYAGLIT